MHSRVSCQMLTEAIGSTEFTPVLSEHLLSPQGRPRWDQGGLSSQE